jgi:hypothetical protein
MADPVIQTIHRDPALLWVARTARRYAFANSHQLLDPAPHHFRYGKSPTVVVAMSRLTDR